MCIAMNGDQLRPGQYAGQHQQPELRGPPGQGRPDVPGLAADRRGERDRRRRRRPADGCRGSRPWPPSGAADAWPTRSRSSPAGRAAPGRERRHGSDRAGPLPQGDRQGRPRRGALPRLAVRGGWLAQGSRLRPRSARDGGPPDPARRRQLRRRVIARARAVGIERLGRPGDPVDLVCRHLPEQQPQERRAADRRRRATHRQLFELSARTPTPS